ncbi:MAG: NlpC/P60 family protein [Absicoccus sp.]|uniref:NlpC/P60 family protein n=1 Tax=Absicoccus intestinalis TaxID=2926319 RepID=A0ABU4WNC1_9FIRM|nr:MULTISPECIES: NlpC/P60 family protein [unclassified Absicoccus]MDX8416909.1 NlpC/P60 family protein [Absicoccus sp. CLA-KB-P134]MDY3036125.1 NlpC/P60 family protein [Absicoccus sp.]
MRYAKRWAMIFASISCLGSLATPVFANEGSTYKVDYKDKSSVIPVFEKMYTENMGTMKYKNTSLIQDQEVMTYESKTYRMEVSGLELDEKGDQNVVFKLSKKNTILPSTEQKKTTVSVVAPKPNLEVSQTTIDTVENKTVDLSSYVSTDEDATLSFSGSVDYSKIGTYTVTATATNKSGGQAETTLTVHVNKDDFYDKIAQAAKAQVGVSQDCTMLVTNSLKAVGIDFHGWPEEYLSLGDRTDNPVPGDICVYQGHVSVYIGNGQAVHGGWNGNQTVITSVQCSSPLIAYVHVRH